MIRSKHRRLANHTGDANWPFMRRIKKLGMRARKAALIREIKRLGWKFLKINRRFTRRFWMNNMAVFRRVVLGAGWVRKTLREQCKILAHELGHIYQVVRLGQAKFLKRYIIAEWRWAIETSANRISQFFWAQHSDDLAEWMYKFYRLGRLRKRDVIRETVAVLG